MHHKSATFLIKVYCFIFAAPGEPINQRQELHCSHKAIAAFAHLWDDHEICNNA